MRIQAFAGANPIALKISKGIVANYVWLAAGASLDWTAVRALVNATLEQRLLTRPARPSSLYASTVVVGVASENGK